MIGSPFIIMMKVAWLLLLLPWLVQGQLGLSTSTTAGATGRPSEAASGKCPELYAWDEHVYDCIPCSVCISYPESPFCSACPEFNQAPATVAVPNFEVDKGDRQASGTVTLPDIIAGITSSILITVVIFTVVMYKKFRQKRENGRPNMTVNGEPKLNNVQPGERMLELRGANCKLNVLIGPHKSTLSTVTSMHGRPPSPFPLPDRNMSDSDSDISFYRTGHYNDKAEHIKSVIPAAGYQNYYWENETSNSVESNDSVCSKIIIATSGCNSHGFYAEALIGKDGGILMLPNAETSLLFSPHSISNQIDISLEILHNPVILPDLGEDETLVSPIVCCGPRWTFHKPVLLTFPHCGMSDTNDFTLLVSETSSQQPPNWEEVSDATPGIEYFVRESECLVYTNHFTKFSLKSSGSKQVRLLAFSSMSDNLYRLRVYCINDTKDAIDRITKGEQKLGFKPTDPGLSMTFLNNKEDIQLRADLETPGWKFLSSQELVINYNSVQGKSDGNFVMFNLQAEPDTKILSLSICASQEGNPDSLKYGVGDVFAARCDHRGACNCRTQLQVCMVQSDTGTKKQARASILNTLGSHRNLTIPHKLRTQLCIKLDPLKERGDDWRSLASDLGLDELIEYFRSKGNPTELVLQEFEKSEKTLKDLWGILIGIERPDAASLVDEYIGKLPSPNSDSGVGSPDTDREASGRDSTPSPDIRFFPNGPSGAGPPQHVHYGGSVPSQDLYNSSQDAISQANSPQFLRGGGSVPSEDLYNSSQATSSQTSSRQYLHCGGSVPSQDLYNSSQDASFQTSSQQYLHCGGSVPSQDLYKSSQDATCISQTRSPQYVHCGGSVPSQDLYNSSQHAHVSQTSSPQYVHCGGSVPSNELYNSCATEPKLIEATGNMQALALNVNSADRENDEPGNGEAQENRIGTDDSVRSQDIEQSTKVMVVTGPELRRLLDGLRETEV